MPRSHRRRTRHPAGRATARRAAGPTLARPPAAPGRASSSTDWASVKSRRAVRPLRHGSGALDRGGITIVQPEVGEYARASTWPVSRSPSSGSTTNSSPLGCPGLHAGLPQRRGRSRRPRSPATWRPSSTKPSPSQVWSRSPRPPVALEFIEAIREVIDANGRRTRATRRHRRRRRPRHRHAAGCARCGRGCGRRPLRRAQALAPCSAGSGCLGRSSGRDLRRALGRCASGRRRADRRRRPHPMRRSSHGVAAARAMIQDYGKAEVGDKTLVDALVPFSESLDPECRRTARPRHGMDSGRRRSRPGGRRNRPLLPRIGRARPHAEKSLRNSRPGRDLVPRASAMTALSRDVLALRRAQIHDPGASE